VGGPAYLVLNGPTAGHNSSPQLRDRQKGPLRIHSREGSKKASALQRISSPAHAPGHFLDTLAVQMTQLDGLALFLRQASQGRSPGLVCYCPFGARTGLACRG
jgi:hypothetical protein